MERRDGDQRAEKERELGCGEREENKIWKKIIAHESVPSHI